MTRGEARSAALAGFLFFLLLSSYFILRPIRDAMAAGAGVSKLPYLFLGTLGVMLLANPAFSGLVARWPVRRFMPATYQFLVLTLLAFYAAQRALGSPWVGRAFFVWTSVFNLFIPSVFWAFMVDRFDGEQAKRLFGYIGVGGTAGSIAGSSAAAFLAHAIGTDNLLLVSAALLQAGTLLVAFYPRAEAPAATRVADDNAVMGGGPLEGLKLVARSPYLLAISGFLFLYTVGSTVLYFEQTDVVGKTFASAADRTAVLARIELAVQATTAVVQALLTARILRGFGIAASLALMPAVSVLGFLAVGGSALASLPLFATVAAFTVARRASNFSVTNPAMEVLFTAVDRPTKFKAKAFVETFVYRLGDQIAAWSYGGLAALGLSLHSIAWLAVPMSVVFGALGLWLGRRYAAMSLAPAPPAVVKTAA